MKSELNHYGSCQFVVLYMLKDMAIVMWNMRMETYFNMLLSLLQISC
jgi:hypothetical protein